MPDLHGLALFVAAGVLLNLTPGVDLLYILGQAGARGLKAAVVATAGVCAGCSVHIAAATLGVSALLATGQLETVLEGWCPPSEGLFLYYPSRRLPPPALREWISLLQAQG